MILYAVLDKNGAIETLFGASPQDSDVYPSMIELNSSDDAYKAYYQKMLSMGIADGMVTPVDNVAETKPA